MYKFIIMGMTAVVLYFSFQLFIGNGQEDVNNKIGMEFLVKNGQNEDVKSTASGLQYKVLTKGDGTIHPTASSNVTVDYHGTLINGIVFDSSVQRGEPVTLDLNKVIPGWVEGIEMMVVGDKYRFYIPNNLAYGDRAIGKIPAGSLLIFEIELLAIN